MLKAILAPAALGAAAFLCLAPATQATPLASPRGVTPFAISAEALSDVTPVQNQRRRNRNNPQAGPNPNPNNNAQANRNRAAQAAAAENARKDRRRKERNAAAVGAAVGILGGLLLSQQPVAEPAPPGFYDEEAHRRDIYYRCRQRYGFDPHTMTYLNRHGEVRRCR